MSDTEDKGWPPLYDEHFAPVVKAIAKAGIFDAQIMAPNIQRGPMPIALTVSIGGLDEDGNHIPPNAVISQINALRSAILKTCEGKGGMRLDRVLADVRTTPGRFFRSVDIPMATAEVLLENVESFKACLQNQKEKLQTGREGGFER